MTPDLLQDLPAIGATRNEPDAEGLVTAISRMGYSIEEALADIIDNSIDARASNVLIRFIRDDSAIKRIVIADDGHGMVEKALEKAMKFGAKLRHELTDLGRYGMGLKSASFSQCRSLSVLSRVRGRVSGRRWTLESIARDWLCEELDPARAADVFGQQWGDINVTDSGTLVIWNSLDKFKQDRAGVDATLDRLNRDIPKHLGLVFHRFLQTGRVAIRMDYTNVAADVPPAVTTVEPLDPFGYSETGQPAYPRRFTFRVPPLAPMEIVAHIWPPKSKAQGYRLGGGRVAQRQGFYFYRNGRLIQAGGWNGWRNDGEPHASLARASIELPPEGDSVFSLNVQKSGVDVPPAFRIALQVSESEDGNLRDYIPDAEAVYRGAEPVITPDYPVVPAGGFPKRLHRELVEAAASGGKVRELDFEWEPLEDDEFFLVDRDRKTIILNVNYRRAVMYGARGSATDAPLVKALLFYLLRDELDVRSVWATRAAHLRQMSRLLALAARFQV